MEVFTHSYKENIVEEMICFVSNEQAIRSFSQLKEEIQTRFNLISAERVVVEQNTFDENWLKNKEVMTFWSFTIFQETFLDQSILCKWVVDDVIASQFHYILYTEMTKISYFSYDRKAMLDLPYNRCKIL